MQIFIIHASVILLYIAVDPYVYGHHSTPSECIYLQNKLEQIAFLILTNRLNNNLT